MNGTGKKHNIDILFLMILFLVFTFSAVSILLMAINSYRSVVVSSEKNASARTLCAYIREVVHQNDGNGSVMVSSFNGTDCVQIDQGDGYSLYIYMYDGKLMELNTNENSGVTLDFGDEIASISDMTIASKNNNGLIEIVISDDYGNSETVDIAVKSRPYSIEPVEEVMDEE